MSRLMYDGINTDAPVIPTGAELVAGYVDGWYAWSAADWARFPHALHVRIAVHAETDDGVVLDVESGDATPAQAVDWVLARRAAGVDPTVYCNQQDTQTGWPAVRAAFQARGVPEPHYWVADYDGDTAIPAGAVAKQYASTDRWDLSSVADYWPGVDPAPANKPQEDEMPAFQTGPIAPGWFTDPDGKDNLDAATMLAVPPPSGGYAGWGRAWFSVGCDFRDVKLRIAIKVANEDWVLHTMTPTAAGDRPYMELPANTQKISIGRVAQSPKDDPGTPCAWLLEYAA